MALGFFVPFLLRVTRVTKNATDGEVRNKLDLGALCACNLSLSDG